MNMIEAIQDRCNYIKNTILPKYRMIGPAGTIGAMLLEQDIKNAESVIASGDVIAMVSTLKSLRETCESAL